ncbi:DUF6179 domain-containing protein [Ruminococcus sp.]|uniref:DUF6179 domain-containing protein n=1 Tax=Ruminococcus sp. TaxID=41978 RepID=UPI0025EFACDA|nr:DUF6179 domain-containing protein [Ruminococcus sp.]MCI5817053.1 DUF6179 domain-containing protein [Ruminococcus sp.]
MLEPRCVCPVDPGSLDPRNYTLSLLGVCEQAGLLDAGQCRGIRQVLDQQFQELAAEYTKRASSTLPRTAARQLYDAVLFRCDAYLKTIPLSRSIQLLQEGQVQLICRRGTECMLDAFARCKIIFRQVYALRCPFPIDAYTYAMEHAFDRFCRSYSARFDPRNDCMGVDYPLLGRPAYALTEEGVWFVEAYYSSLLLENQLCRMIPASALEALFAGYARIYHCQPEDLHINGAELVVNQLLAGFLFGAEPLQVLFAEADGLRCLGVPDAPALTEAFSCRYAKLFPAPLLAYVAGYIPQFLQEWSLRRGYRSLANWLVLP